MAIAQDWPASPASDPTVDRPDDARPTGWPADPRARELDASARRPSWPARPIDPRGYGRPLSEAELFDAYGVGRKD